MGLLDASSGTEMSLGLAHGRSSKKERVGAYYNYILDIEKQKKTHRESKWGSYLREIS